ncbi:MAG: NUDIX domain-containing protein [Patescibacteria group bacterium]|nr:NUDIX domain-containing protein [Patescibacteria group bacterium]
MNPTDISQLPYRNNISCIVFKEGRYLLVQQVGWLKNFWKFPQGGIKNDECDKETIKRELWEELGIKKCKIIGVGKHLNQYDWSPASVKLAGLRWRGQTQKFYLIKYLGADKEIVLCRKEHQNYRWVERRDLRKHIDHDHKNFTNYYSSVEKVLTEYGM